MAKVYLFQYGSNLDTNRLNSQRRLDGAATYIAPARLDGHRLVFDLHSKKNDCAAADIIQDTNSEVIGALYEVEENLVISPDGGMSKMDGVENAKPDGSGNYARHAVEVKVVPNGEIVKAFTYIGTNSAREKFLKGNFTKTVSRIYLGHILSGARQKQFPEEYIAQIETTAHRHNEKFGKDSPNE